MDLTRGEFLGGLGAIAVPSALLASAARADTAPPQRASRAPVRYRIGDSVRGRPIHAYRLGRDDAPSRYLVVGCMHGEEPVGTEIVRKRLLHRHAPDGVQLWLIPTVNPDGYAHGRRTNAHGVDLNRNFAGPHWEVQGEGSIYYSGPEPASEPETRDVQRFLTDLAPHTIVSMHQPLACVDFSGGTRGVTLWLAQHLGLPARKLASSGGNMTTWFNHLYPHKTAVTVELRRPTNGAMRRHTADVLVRHAAVRAGG